MEIEKEESGKPCRLNKADFVALQKQVNADKNIEIRQKLEETNGLPNLSLITEGNSEQIGPSRRDSILPSIELLSRSTANALRQLFDHKEKQAAWIYLWSEFFEVMTSSSIENNERSDVLTGSNEIRGFGHSNLEEQVQILDHMLGTIKSTKVMKDAVSIGKGREHSPAIRQAIRGLRPFQRGIIWSITSIKYLYNDLIMRYGGASNLIPIHQDQDEPNIFRCLDMDRLCYTDLDADFHRLIQEVNNSVSTPTTLEATGDISSNLALNGEVVVDSWTETDSAIASIIEGQKPSSKESNKQTNRNKTRPYNYNPLRALIPTNSTLLGSSGSPNKKLEKSQKKKVSNNASEDKQSSQKRLGSPTPWKNPTQVLEYYPPSGSKIHMPADHPQLSEVTHRDNLELIGTDDSGVSIVYTDSNGQPIQNQALPSLTTVTISEDNIPIHLSVEPQPRKNRNFDVNNVASGIIESSMIRQKSDNSVITKKQKMPSKSTKKQRQKGKKTGLGKRQQNYDGDVTSEDEDSEDIEYDDSDNNANVAGADEADSMGDVEDSVGEMHGLQEVHQVN